MSRSRTLVSHEWSVTFSIRRISARIRRIKNRLSDFLFYRFIAALMRKAINDDISNLSASTAYYIFLALFPLLLVLLAIFSLFLPPESVQEQLVNFFSQYLPGQLNIFQGNIPDSISFRSAFGVVGIIGLIWSASGIFSSVSTALNKAWEVQYKHPFYIKKPLEILMALGTGILFLFSFGASTVLSIIGDWNLPISSLLVNAGTALIAFLFSLLVFLLLNKVVPIIGISWRYIWPGAVLSTVIFEIAKTLFVFYVNRFSHFDQVYGPIASIIILLVWIYCSTFILIMGAEFNWLLFKLKREGENFDKAPDRTREDLRYLS